MKKLFAAISCCGLTDRVQRQKEETKINRNGDINNSKSDQTLIYLPSIKLTDDISTTNIEDSEYKPPLPEYLDKMKRTLNQSTSDQSSSQSSSKPKMSKKSSSIKGNNNQSSKDSHQDTIREMSKSNMSARDSKRDSPIQASKIKTHTQTSDGSKKSTEGEDPDLVLIPLDDSDYPCEEENLELSIIERNGGNGKLSKSSGGFNNNVVHSATKSKESAELKLKLKRAESDPELRNRHLLSCVVLETYGGLHIALYGRKFKSLIAVVLQVTDIQAVRHHREFFELSKDYIIDRKREAILDSCGNRQALNSSFFRKQNVLGSKGLTTTTPDLWGRVNKVDAVSNAVEKLQEREFDGTNASRKTLSIYGYWLKVLDRTNQ